MSDSTISQLPLASSVSGTDYIPIDQGGVTKKATLAQIGNGTVLVASGKVLTVSNTLTLAGTDGTTLTFPSTSATIARTDAAQTFTGVQTFTSTIVGGITGNAGTATLAAAATVLATPRGINGVNFDGSAAITVPVNNTDDTTTNATVYPLWTATVGGNYAAKVSSTQLTFNPSSGILTATGFAGPLTGNVTGNVSGSSGSTTGNAATATALQTARTIDGISFDGTANILVVAPAIHAAINKTTPVDADEVGIWDSVSGLLNHVTWANLKATLKTYFDTLYAKITPTQQIFLSGSGTYTTPANVKYITIMAVGGGGGGWGGGTTQGTSATSGANTTFGTTLISAGGGSAAGAWAGQGGAGGTSSLGTATGIALTGSGGNGSLFTNNVFCTGGSGGPSALGGQGASGSGGAFGVGGAGAANTGGGGGGGGVGNATGNGGAGGGSGGYVEATIISPDATYAYSVGTGGTAGGAGGTGSAGGAGGSGIIVVTEYY